MVKKCKVSDLAKDLNITSKELIEVLGEYTEGQKKTSTILTEEEINIALEIYSKKNEVANFDEYFASAADKPKTRKKVTTKKKENSEKGAVKNKKADVSTDKKDSSEKNKSQKAVVAKKSAAKKSEKKNIVQSSKSKNISETHKKPKRKAKLTETIELKPATDEPSTNVVKEKDSNHHVDTKSVQVNLDKYNERYENMAQQNNISDNFQKKQKIKQRGNKKHQRSNKKETEAQKLQRLALERARKQKLKVKIPDEIVVSELASRLKVNVAEVIKKLIALGVMSGMNDIIDFDTAAIVSEELGAKVEHEVTITIEERLFEDEEDDSENLEKRDPIVVVMGHVDHGKTSLLDKIRNSEVTSGEAGGITQHIGAYKVHDKTGKSVTFLDTPGHEAFTSMRMRGANMTDIAILVVAADDGIMPQTVEAINHAKAAEVSVIVAINKIDKPEANIDRVKQGLTEHGLIPEEWGGDIICVPVSAKTGEGIEQLLEMVDLVAEVKELKANPNRFAKGAVVEAYLDKGRGPVATLLVQNGTLKVGDSIIAGVSVGRVRAMINDKGQEVESAGPSTPVEITGLSEVPSAGDVFNAVENEKLAKELVDKRKFAEKQERFASYNKVTLDNLFSQIEEGERKELPIVVKADVQGSVEAVKNSLEKLSNEEVKVKVIHGAVGAINKSDVMLANASNAIIIGFNVRPDSVAKRGADEHGIELRLYRVIYDAIEDVEQAIKGMLKPKTREVNLGTAEVREVYKISSVGTIAGCYITEGKVLRSAQIRLVRDGIVIVEDTIKSLKRFKDDAKEVAKGFECGIGLEKFNDIKVGDIFESFMLEEYRD